MEDADEEPDGDERVVVVDPGDDEGQNRDGHDRHEEGQLPAVPDERGHSEVTVRSQRSQSEVTCTGSGSVRGNRNT